MGRRLLEIVPIKPAWERALDRLQVFLAPAPALKAEAATRARRLIFRFDPTLMDIEPVEQIAKGQAWSPGRVVSVKRLNQRDPKIDYLTAEDEAVLKTIRLEKNHYNETYYFDAVRGPLALVGHPRVFDAAEPERRIELVAYPVELVVREQGDRLRIDLSHRAGAPRVLVEPETPTRWRVIEVTPALVELAETLGAKGLDVPRGARERVITLVKTENPRLPVRSELHGVATEAVMGETRPILRIAPEGEGFDIQALVRPLGEAGPSYVPGVGARSVLSPTEGGHRRINRDLSAESAALEAVAQASPPWRLGARAITSGASTDSTRRSKPCSSFMKFRTRLVWNGRTALASSLRAPWGRER